MQDIFCKWADFSGPKFFELCFNSIAVFSCVLFLLSGCANNGLDAPTLPVGGNAAAVQALDGKGGALSGGIDSYRLGPNDEISLTVFGERDLSVIRQLDGQGVVDLPLIGRVDLSTLTSSQAVQKISARYQNGYLQSPQITLQIIKYRPFFVLGEVGKPGRYDYQENITVLEAVAASEGFTYRANQKSIEIIRKINNQPQSFTANTHSIVLPGDIIKIKERFF